jgi:hypothetical protein
MCSRLDDPSEYEGPRTEAGKRLRDGVRNGNGGLDLARQIAVIEAEAAQRALDDAVKVIAALPERGASRLYGVLIERAAVLAALRDRGADREDVTK